MLAHENVNETGDYLIVSNPYTGEQVGRVRKNTFEEIGNALRRVDGYQQDLPAMKRAEILGRCARLLEESADDFARSITSESGICLSESRKEVRRSIGNFRVAAEEAIRIHGEALRLSTETGEKLALTLHEPVGVVAAITPFNRPLNQVVVKLAPAIASNNALIVKPSEKTPLTCFLLKELTMRAGLPDNMFQVVVGEPETVAHALIDAPETNLVTFTGSVAIGRKIAERAGLKKVLLELGGNDPMIVLADADLEAAARLTVDGATATAGQTCRGVKRVLVAEPVADRFVELLVELVENRNMGDPFDPDTQVSCMIGVDEAKNAQRKCEDAIRKGARLIHGGDRQKAMLQPTVLDHVPSSAELVRTETFAPVVPVTRFTTLDEAIEIVNSTEYGLQAGVATTNVEDFMRLAKDLEVGAVNLMEGPQFDSPHIPFGGVKSSGIGREGIRYAIREMTVIKTVVLPWERHKAC